MILSINSGSLSDGKIKDLSENNKPNWVQSEQGGAFQFTEHYSGPGLQTHTIIQRETTVQSVTESTSIFSN